MKVFDHFDRIRVINLRYRTNRRREMDRELAAVGLDDDPRVAYFAAIRPSDSVILPQSRRGQCMRARRRS